MRRAFRADELYNANAARAVIQFSTMLRLMGKQGVSQPPPKRRPGPSDARKMGLRSATASFEAACKAACRAAPHVEEPRLPEVRAIGGKASGDTPKCFASRASRRGFGWGVAKPLTALREMPLRNSTAPRTSSKRVLAARQRASPFNLTVRPAPLGGAP